ncbi:MAG TPA: GatB/YqeY domain-containing protein [Polyangiaceae bacterium]
MLLDEIKARMFKAMKEGRVVEKEILRVAVGEITTNAAREGMRGSDEEAQATLRKLMKSNEESLKVCEDAEQRANLELEQRTLSDLLPKSLSVEEILVSLASVKDAVVAAANLGQATGIAMKQLKSVGAVVGGKDVSAAVTQMRA